MVFYNDPERNLGQEPQIQKHTIQGSINTLIPKTKTVSSQLPKHKDLDDYMVVMRQPTFLEQKANPKLKSVVTNIIDKKSPHRNVAPEDVGMGGIAKLPTSYIDVSTNTDVSGFLTKEGAAKFKRDSWLPADKGPLIASNVKQREQLYYPYRLINPDNSLRVVDRKGEYLFRLKGKNKEENTIGTKLLNEKKKQWFAPEANNYMPITDINKDIKKNKSLKHFTSDDVFEFADTTRGLFNFGKGGSGDWKAQKKGGDGYTMSTVDGKPYWTDAIGQVPFAINTYKNSLLAGNLPKKSKKITSTLGGLAAEGDIWSIVKRVATLNPDTSNSYDNKMIERSLDWASEKYKKPTRSTYLHKTEHPVNKLFDYED